jgi:hypothetical protein
MVVQQRHNGGLSWMIEIEFLINEPTNWHVDLAYRIRTQDINMSLQTMCSNI